MAKASEAQYFSHCCETDNGIKDDDALTCELLSDLEQDIPSQYPDTTSDLRYVKILSRPIVTPYGETYTGIDRETGNEVTWRVVKPGRISRGDFARWFQELKHAQNFHHPHVVSYLHSEMRSENEAILIEEMVTAGSLRAFLKTFSNPKLRICQSWFLQLLDGLQFLHSRRIIHGNLSCGHVYLNTNIGELKIGDIAVVHLSNALHGNWKSLHDDIRNFGILMLEVALTQRFAADKQLKRTVSKMYDLNPEATKKNQEKLLNLIQNEQYKTLVETCLNALPGSITVAELKNHPFFEKELEGYVSDILASGRKKRVSKKLKPQLDSVRKSLPLKNTWTVESIEAKITKNTMRGKKKKKPYLVDVCIKHKKGEYVKTISFRFDMRKDTVFGIIEEMRVAQVLPEKHIWATMLQMYKAISEYRKMRMDESEQKDLVGEYSKPDSEFTVELEGYADETITAYQRHHVFCPSFNPSLTFESKKLPRTTPQTYKNYLGQHIDNCLTHRSVGMTSGYTLWNMGNISPIENASAISEGTTGTFFEHMIRPTINLHRTEFGKSPTKNASCDFQSTPRDNLEEDCWLKCKLGDTYDVKIVQRALNELLGIHLEENGKFTEETQEAVREYQESKKLEITGEIDEDFWEIIVKDLKSKQQDKVHI